MESLRKPLILAFVLLSTTAVAHSWYDAMCCSDQDCKAVADGLIEAGPTGWVVRDLGTSEVVPYGSPKIKVSRDEHDHVCRRLPSSHTPFELLCIYPKPRGT